jgi:hypothetical protein
MPRTLLLAAVVAALASPIDLQAANSGPRLQAQPAPVRTHATRHHRLSGTNKTTDVTLKRGVIKSD